MTISYKACISFDFVIEATQMSKIDVRAICTKPQQMQQSYFSNEIQVKSDVIVPKTFIGSKY